MRIDPWLYPCKHVQRLRANAHYIAKCFEYIHKVFATLATECLMTLRLMIVSDCVQDVAAAWG
jgi:hypothetical protein